MKDDASDLFEAELSRRGLGFAREDEDLYSIQIDGQEVSIDLTNVRRNAERDVDPGIIVRFVDRILASVRDPGPGWPEAAAYLLFSAEPADQDFGDTIRESVSDRVVRVLTLTDAEESRITWVDEPMCRSWGITPQQASALALANQSKLLDGVELEVTDVQGHKLGMVPVEGPYKASIIFAPELRRLVEARLGWPVCVVAPCRDFIYVVCDDSPLIPRLGSVVVSEFKSSGYPISTEVLRISDDGIEAVGYFPV